MAAYQCITVLKYGAQAIEEEYLSGKLKNKMDQNNRIHEKEAIIRAIRTIDTDPFTPVQTEIMASLLQALERIHQDLNAHYQTSNKNITDEINDQSESRQIASKYFQSRD